ncbi:MAG: hypothetical protein AAF193_00455 [Bacteroidota bacterium]
MRIAVGLVLISVLTWGCGGNKHSAEVDQIQNCLKEAEVMKPRFDSIPHDELLKVASITQLTMARFNRSYDGDLDKEQARIVSDFNDVKRLLKGYESQYNRISDEFERTNSQIAALSETLKSGATLDAAGNKIDEAYVKKQVDQECKVANSLAQEVTEFSERGQRALSQFAIAKQPMDSLLNEILP